MGFGILAAFLLSGVLAAEGLFGNRPRATRLYLGLTTGLVLMMWLPSAWSFLFGFTVKAQWWALGSAFALSGVLYAFVGRKDAPKAIGLPPRLLLLILPFLLFSFYLQYTHTLRPVDGAMHVGQSTYGDLSLHLGIATGLRNASYPPEYTLLPGTMLGYPFLADAMVTTMLLFGAPLAWSFIATGTLMMGLVFWGFLLLAWELSGNRRATAIAFLLMFLNGGLGFLYTFDGVFRDNSRLMDALYGFYLTPTNTPDLNLRWVNVIADLMIPQRTLLAGWTVVIPALLMLAQAVGRREALVHAGPYGPVSVITQSEGALREYAILGVWAGLMPMIHTHSFLALGLVSLGAMGSMIARRPAERMNVLRNFAVFGGIALALALPQLLTWTFPQTAGGGSLKFHLNWVNNVGGLIDGWLWFWVKNVGLVFLLFVPAALSADRRGRALAAGALTVFVLAETILFQPNPYDNNKLFYVAFILMVPAAARYVVSVYDRISGVKWRGVFLAAFLVVSTLSAAVTLAREAISDYELFGEAEVSAAHFIEGNAPGDAVVLTGGQHNNPVAALAGRKLVCGTGTYLYYHGVNYQRQQEAARAMYEAPEDNTVLFDVYHVDYAYVSSYERADYAVDEAFFKETFPVAFKNSEVTVYAVSPRAAAAAQMADASEPEG